MSQRRQDKPVTRVVEEDGPEMIDSVAPVLPETILVEEEDLPEIDVEIVPLEPRAVEPADPVSAAMPPLSREDPLKDFSDNARRRYHLETSAWGADLRRQSLAHKKSTGGDNVSEANVASAAHFLRAYRSRGWLKHLGAFGGVLIGLGAQTIGSMVETGVYTTGGVLWGVGNTAVGVALFVWHATRDRA